MKKLLLFSLIFMYVLTITGCGPKSKDAITIVKEYWAALDAHDLDKAMSYLADDAIGCCDDTNNTVQGREKIRALFQQMFSIYPDIRNQNSDYSEKNGEVRYTYKMIIGSNVVASGSDGLTIVKDGKIIFDGLESNKPK
jgi:limonene-1,2-epoxide hydrolase